MKGNKSGFNKRRMISPPSTNPPGKQARIESTISRGAAKVGVSVPKSNGIPSPERGVTEQRKEMGIPAVGHGSTERQGENVQAPNVLPADADNTNSITTGIEKRIITQINMVYRKLMTEMKEKDAVIADLSKTLHTIEQNVSCIKALTTQLSAAIARQNGSRGTGTGNSRRRGTSLSLEQELQNLAPTVPIEIRAVFTVELFCLSAAQAVCLYMDTCHDAQEDIRMTAKTLTVLLYGLRRDMSRNAFKIGTGRQHANLRFKIAKTVVRNALLITDDEFKEQEQQVLAEVMRSSTNGSETSAALEPSGGKPEWLNAVFLAGPVLALARKYHECVRSEVGSPPTDPHRRKSLTVCRYVVKTTNDLLRVSRDRCKQKLFEAGTFLLTDWSKRPTFGDNHCNPTIRFVHPSAVAIKSSEIQDCLAKTEDNFKTANAGLLAHLIAGRQEMQIEATYNVTVVVRSNGRKKNPDPVTEIREIRRDFNIIRMSLVFFEAFLQCKEEFLLATHPSMLHNIYRFALLIRDFFIDNVEDGCRPQRSSLLNAVHRGVYPAFGQDDEDEITPNAQTGMDDAQSILGGDGHHKTAEVRLSDLLPGESETDKEIMKVLKITADAYDKYMVKENGDNSGGDLSRIDEDDRVSGRLDSDEDELDGMIDM